MALAEPTSFVARSSRITAEWLNAVDERLIGPVFNVKGRRGARGDGTAAGGGADDTEPILRTLEDLKAEGIGRIEIPAGNYRCDTRVASGGIGWTLAIAQDNVHLQGVPGQSRIFTTLTNAATLYVTGAGKRSGINSWGSDNLQFMDTAGEGLLPLTGSYARGGMSLTLADADDAATLSAGELIYIRTGQLLTSTNFQPDAELNKVRAVDGATVYLAYPLSKPYAQEYYISGTTGLTSTTETANPAPYGIVKATDVVLQNVTIRDLIIENTASSGISLIPGGQVYGLRWENVEFRGPSNIISQGTVRDQWFSQCRFEMRGTATSYYMVGLSTGNTHTWIDRCVSYAPQSVGHFHAHEGVADTYFTNNIVMNAPVAANVHSVSIYARCYNMNILDNTFINSGSNVMCYVDNTCLGGGQIAGNRFEGNCDNAIGVGSPGWRIDGNLTTKPIYRTVQTVAGGTSTTGFEPVSTQSLEAWVADDLQTATLGLRPAYTTVTEVLVYVDQAFNSDGTDQITVGYDGAESAFATAVDVSSTGWKTVTLGSGAAYSASGQTAKVYYANGGSEPSTGRALVILRYVPVPVRVT